MTSEPLAAPWLSDERIPAGASWLSGRPRSAVLGVLGVIVAFGIGALAVVNLRYGVAGVVGLALVTVVLLRPYTGAVILVALVPITSGLAPGFPLRNMRISEVLIGVVGVTLLVSARRRDALPWRALDWLLLAYGLGWALFGVVGAVTLHEHLTLSDWGTTAGQLQFFLLYRGIRTGLRSVGERHRAMVILLGASVPVAALAILQELHAPGVRGFVNTITGGPTAAPGSTPASGSILRATGPFDNWAALAGYFLPLLLVLFTLALGGQARRFGRVMPVVAVFAVLGLFVTAELSAIGCLVCCIIVLSVKSGHARKTLRWVGLGMLATALVVGPFIGQRLSQELSSSAGSSRHAGVPQTLQFRWNVWSKQYIPAIEARPVDGYGVVLPPTIAWKFPESQYVQLLITGGLPLLLVFGALTWSMIDHGRALARAPDPFDQALGKALVAAVIALAAMDAIWPYVSNGGLPQVLWCLFAIATPRTERAWSPLRRAGGTDHPAVQVAP